MGSASLGIIEMIGFSAAVTAADIAVKTADVVLQGYELAGGGGLTTVKITGGVSAVSASVEAVRKSYQLQGKVFAAAVIARPAEGMESMIHNAETIRNRKSEKPAVLKEEPAENTIVYEEKPVVCEKKKKTVKEQSKAKKTKTSSGSIKEKENKNG